MQQNEDLEEEENEDGYETIQGDRSSCVEEAVPRDIYKSRYLNHLDSLRESLVGFKDGVPGVYSGFKKKDGNAEQLDDQRQPNPPPRKRRSLRRLLSSSRDSDADRRETISDVISELKEEHVEIPAVSSPTSVILPCAMEETGKENESDDSASWGSDFETPLDEKDKEIYEVVGQSDLHSRSSTMNSTYENIADININKPPLPPRHSIIFESLVETDLDKETYIPVDMESELPAVLPPLNLSADEIQKKRHRIIECVLKNEECYMKNLNKLIKEYEQPLMEHKIIGPDRIKVIFKHVHEIMQCHQLFNMALCDRVKHWNTNDVIGDVIYASFSKSMVLKAYSSFVCHFSNALDSVKQTCKLVPAFLNFLKQRVYISCTKSLYELMRQPLLRIPQLVVLLQALMQVTPFPHPDRLAVQMAITHLECLSETLAEKRRDALLKHKVQHLDLHSIGLTKTLATSRKRYYVRHDDMILCVVEEGKVVKTKLRRIFMLSDLLICASVLHKPQQMKNMTSKRYKIKWCVPINDVELVEVGQGVTVNITLNKTTVIKYSDIMCSSRPDKVNKAIEDLEHDITMIGQIAGLVFSLRRNYRFTDAEKVNNWYKDVRSTLDREIALANMHWVELSLPTNNHTESRETFLFNVHSPMRKVEWMAELENVRLRLAYDNNPGWYIQEEVSGETVVLRRTLPLLSTRQDLFMIEPKYNIDCIVEISGDRTTPLVWVFSGEEHLGVITVLELSHPQPPHTHESFVVGYSRICSAELVDDGNGEAQSVWVGTMSGTILVYEVDRRIREPVHKTHLRDTVTSIKYFNNKMFAGLANGLLSCFRKDKTGDWDFLNPTQLFLDVHPVLCMVDALDCLWCACGSRIYILNTHTFGIEGKIETAQETSHGAVKALVICGMGVWVANRKSSYLNLYHMEGHQLLQTINVTTSLQRMKSDIDVIPDFAPDKVYVTSLLAREGLLWIGLNIGLIVTYPLPRLGGIPTVSGQACVSFHAHRGPVKHIHAYKLRPNQIWKQMVEKETNPVKDVPRRRAEYFEDNAPSLDHLSLKNRFHRKSLPPEPFEMDSHLNVRQSAYFQNDQSLDCFNLPDELNTAEDESPKADPLYFTIDSDRYEYNSSEVANGEEIAHSTLAEKQTDSEGAHDPFYFVVKPKISLEDTDGWTATCESSYQPPLSADETNNVVGDNVPQPKTEDMSETDDLGNDSAVLSTDLNIDKEEIKSAQIITPQENKTADEAKDEIANTDFPTACEKIEINENSDVCKKENKQLSENEQNVHIETDTQTIENDLLETSKPVIDANDFTSTPKPNEAETDLCQSFEINAAERTVEADYLVAEQNSVDEKLTNEKENQLKLNGETDMISDQVCKPEESLINAGQPIDNSINNADKIPENQFGLKDNQAERANVQSNMKEMDKSTESKEVESKPVKNEYTDIKTEPMHKFQMECAKCENNDTGSLSNLIENRVETTNEELSSFISLNTVEGKGEQNVDIARGENHSEDQTSKQCSETSSEGSNEPMANSNLTVLAENCKSSVKDNTISKDSDMPSVENGLNSSYEEAAFGKIESNVTPEKDNTREYFTLKTDEEMPCLQTKNQQSDLNNEFKLVDTPSEDSPPSVVNDESFKEQPSDDFQQSYSSAASGPYEQPSEAFMPHYSVVHKKKHCDYEHFAMSDLYRTLPLPHSPSTLDVSVHQPLYTSLQDVKPPSPLSIKEHTLTRSPPDKNYYASLTDVSQQDEEAHRETLAAPWYVISIGAGYVDLRQQQQKKSSPGLFHSFVHTDVTPQIFLWKLT